jgi:putative inorganic carbon (hco3(-)) transporter
VLKAPRILWLLGAAVLAILVARPQAVTSRLTVSDASSRDRIYMWQSGFEMIRDKPVFGQGPGMILKSYPEYRWQAAPNAQAPHLHDNALQIAAERGLPCLAWWVWLMAVAMADGYRLARSSADTAIWGVSSFAILVALMIAGLFEYNFGDSEILMAVLLVLALPYSVRAAHA